jgi:hypothetical protein
MHAEKLTAEQRRHIEEELTGSPMRHRWQRAMIHVQHLSSSTSAYDALGPLSLRLWLECWRLEGFADRIEAKWNCRARQDVLAVDSTVAAAANVGMRPLEVRRWRRGQELLRRGVELSSKDFKFLTATLPSLGTWLQSFDLGHMLAHFNELGADSIHDVLDFDTYTLETMGLTARDLRSWRRAIKSLSPPGTEAAAPLGYGSSPPQQKMASLRLPAGTKHVSNYTLRGWLERYHVSRLAPLLTALGADSPVDLLDLSSEEVTDLRMRKLEKERWDQCVVGVQQGIKNLKAFNALLPYAPEEETEPLDRIDPDSISHLLRRREPTPEPVPIPVPTPMPMPEPMPEPVPRALTPRAPTPEPEPPQPQEAPKETAQSHQLVQPQIQQRSDEYSFIDQVLQRASGFRANVAQGKWSDLTLRELFEGIGAAANAQSSPQGRHNLHALIVALLEGLSAERSRYGAFVATAFQDPALVHSAATEVGYLRIAATLIAMTDDDAAKLQDNFTTHHSVHSLEGSPRTFGAELQPSLSAQEPPPERSPSTIRAEPVELDARVLEKLRYRWLSASLSLQGQRARHAWVEKYRPPDNLAADDNSLTLGALRRLCRSVLQITAMEVSEDELEWFFSALDPEDTGHASFYKLLGLLETEGSVEFLRSSIKLAPTRKKGAKKRRPKSAKVSFVQPHSWRHPGKNDLSALRLEAGYPF